MKSASKSAIALIAGVAALPVMAQSFTPTAIKTESGIDFTPLLQAKLSHDSNIASASENEQSSWILEITPALLMSMAQGANQYSLNISAAKGNYFSSSLDNYLDFFIDTNALIDINQSNRLSLTSQYVSGHENRGTGVSEGLGGSQAEPVEFDTFRINGYYEYGALSTPARIRFLAGYFDKEYTNFEIQTRFRNFDTLSFGTIFFYDTQATTRLVAEITQENLRYDLVDPSGNRDSDTRKYRIGIDWEATALTSGTLRIGYQDKDFVTNEREDFGGLTWDASVAYQPLSYSTFRVTTGRAAKDPNVEGDFVKESKYGVNWQHNWSDFLSSTLSYNYTHEKFTGITRTDKLNSYGIAVDYLLLPNVQLALGAAINDKTSSVPTIQFDKTVFSISVRAGF
ncbi:outer membrane beta-barrel protein [Alishewanella sp. d11]|uniref:outer membrane beta-barrel protein n=1 Tax=Alishewanella sp. d11 TaxID=3414030 RepID=UPI003BF79DD5